MNLIKEREMAREPVFLRFINKELQASDLLAIYARSPDPFTVETITRASENPPDLEPFRQELTEAVRDLIKEGVGEEFKAFVNHYMGSSLIEDVERQPTKFGESVSRTARIGDAEAPWLQGFICYNLSLYVKAFGLENLKCCKVCSKYFNHKGKYAVYCSDKCKKEAKSNPEKA